ncbi:hypothetical protein ALC56_06483 [Trachymyrmex septentrionalis]|uniref:Uncharacterized protein n=1 Tax=Trachymyrmex septentrionalis TaxID=34720 RepID=A0A195FFQ1_9HYME|nr:PREDICTED: uncharacterized protein LOC108748779 [Trachymyrmex septentrionalis]KYN39057.1 hypothetical protein ALC56_06483 [Trachymyrmex septentrionalis]
MFPTVDLYDVPPTWWETDCVKYGLSYPPVRSRLTSLMGTNVVRLTDRRYMLQLTSRLQEDYEAQQKARIERRKLKAVSIVPQLSELLPRSLLKATRRRRECGPTFHAYAAKMCKQLPQILFTNDSEFHFKC